MEQIGLATNNKTGTQYSFNYFTPIEGAQYASIVTQDTLKSYTIVQSMSRARNCLSNVVAEIKFKLLKSKLIYRTKSVGPKRMRNRIFEYIELWHKK